MQSTPPALGHITLLNDVWLFNIHSPFFTMTIMLFTNKGGNHIHDFIIFPTYCSDARGHTVTTSEQQDVRPTKMYLLLILCSSLKVRQLKNLLFLFIPSTKRNIAT